MFKSKNRDDLYISGTAPGSEHVQAMREMLKIRAIG